jgi:hypothetical protein
MKSAAIGATALLLVSLTATSPVYSAGGEYLPDDDPVSTLDLSFRLYAGGIPFGDATMAARIQGDQYLASSTIETSGLINRWWESKIEAASNGSIAPSLVKPFRYDNFTTRRGRRQEYVISFREDGPDSIYTNPQREYDEEELPPSADEARHSMDPLSAMVYLVNSYDANGATPCQTVAPVYDGRRRYDVTFRFVESENIRMDNGLYEGPAMTCEIVYRQVAGELQNVVENGGEMPKVFGWIAEVPSPDDPSRRYMIPLRLWSNTEFGVITAVATELRIDGKSVGYGT